MDFPRESTTEESHEYRRRRIVQALGAVGLAGIAGCLGDDDDDPDDADDSDVSDDTDDADDSDDYDDQDDTDDADDGVGDEYDISDQPDDAAVMFVTPEDAETVESPVHVEAEVEGIDLVQAGEPAVGEGHLHVLVNREPFNEGETIPGPSEDDEEDGIYHWGDGSSEGELELEPGDHNLVLQIADGAHVAFGETDQISIVVAPELTENQYYWSADDYDEGDTPDDAWAPADDDLVESFAIGSDDDGNYLAFDGADSTRAFLRFLPAGSDASDVQIWARAKSDLDGDGGGGDYGYYFRGENDLDDGETHTLRFDDHAVSDQFRLSAFIDNDYNTLASTSGDRHGIGHGEAYETYGLVDGDTYTANYWPAGEGQPTEWALEVDLDAEGVDIDGPGHLGLMYHMGEPLKIYEFSVGVDGEAAP